MAYDDHERLLGAGVCLQRCGYFTRLCDCLETTSDVSATDQLEACAVDVEEEPVLSARGQELRGRTGRRPANRRRPITGNWQGSRAESAVTDQYEHEAVINRRPAARGGRHPRTQRQRYRGQGRGVAFDYDQQVYAGDGPHRGVVEGRGFVPQQRRGRYRRPGQVDRGYFHQHISSDNWEVHQPADRGGFRARGGRGGPQFSGPHTGPSYYPEQFRGQRSRARGQPYRGGASPAASFHCSMESLDDAASVEGVGGYSRRVVDVPNEIGCEKCQVLIYHISGLKQFGCRVFIDIKNHQVIVSGGGTEQALDKTVELVYQTLVAMQPVKWADISPDLASALLNRKATKWARELLKEHKKLAAFYTDSGSVYVIAANEATSREAVALLSDQIKTVDVPFTESQLTFLQSQGWQNFIASAQKNWIMTVDILSSPVNVIRLTGVSSHLSDAESIVRSQLSEKSVSVAELEMSSGELGYLAAYRKDFW